MAKRHDYSAKEKTLIFKVIKFCDQKKSGALIPLNNVNDRIMCMLGFFEQTTAKMRKEMYELEEQQNKPDDEQQAKNAGQHDRRSHTTFDSTLPRRFNPTTGPTRIRSDFMRISVKPMNSCRNPGNDLT